MRSPYWPNVSPILIMGMYRQTTMVPITPPRTTSIKGSIIEVTRAAEEKIFRGVVTLNLPDARLVPGLSVYVDFVVKRKEEALLVPREAIRETASAYTVYVVRKGRAYVQDVEIGLKDSLSVEILKGLEEGSVVVTSPPESLRDRARVRIGKRFPGR